MLSRGAKDYGPVFKLKKVVFVNRRFFEKSKIHENSCFHFKLLFDVVRNSWHPWYYQLISLKHSVFNFYQRISGISLGKKRLNPIYQY